MGKGFEGYSFSQFCVAGGLTLSATALWLLATGTVRVHELLVGFGAVVLSTLFLTPVFTEELRQYTFHASDLLTCWRLPWYLLSSSWEIVAVLARDLMNEERAPSIYRVCGFKTAKDDPRMVARRALAAAYTSVAPNFIVIGIDYCLSRMLFHQIRRSPVPLMTKQLGALIPKSALGHERHRQEGKP